MLENEFRDSVRKAFLVWSWVALLGALIATTSTFATQLFFVITQGLRAVDWKAVGPIGFSVYILPSTSLLLAWLIFYRYSGLLYGWIIFPESSDTESGEFVAHRLWQQFRLSLLYLMVTWLLIIAATAMPFLIEALR